MDIVKRLKMRSKFFREHKISNPDADMDDEAAAEIERLREALKPFADVVKGNWNEQPDTMPMSYGFGVDKRFDLTLGDFRKARAALKGEK